MPVYHLDIEVEYDFELIGLSSHEKDYRLVWSLNKHMQWNLARAEDVLLETKGQHSRHSRFEYRQLNDMLHFTLLDNKTPEGLLMPELAQFDFLLKIEDPASNLDDDFYRKLRKTPFLLAAFPLEVNKLKNRHHLITEEESEE